jgi:lipopolysaccharide biosynthesis regulator YciM
MSGWQYREFFRSLLPRYADIGVADAAEQVAQLEDDEHMTSARGRLTELYQDEDLMRQIPIEL